MQIPQVNRNLRFLIRAIKASIRETKIELRKPLNATLQRGTCDVPSAATFEWKKVNEKISIATARSRLVEPIWLLMEI